MVTELVSKLVPEGYRSVRDSSAEECMALHCAAAGADAGRGRLQVNCMTCVTFPNSAIRQDTYPYLPEILWQRQGTIFDSRFV